ncbi:MAG: RluA family pseudouridine synthase [Gammaproteobacteria bacterium]|nr:RluA family pseudouridine synthase [Gammaproteobacteria bacterium]
MSREVYTADLLIPESKQGARIDQVVSSLLKDVSRTEVKRWILDGSVTVNGNAVKPSFRVKGSEQVSVRGQLSEPMDWDSQQDVEFQVVFEDDDVLVVDKPAGVVVHPGSGNASGTLVNGLIAHRPVLSQLPRAGIVHRLDKDTSGLLVVAASKVAVDFLVNALALRQVTRKYVCVLEGVMESSQRVDLPIGRHSVHRTRQQARSDGRPASTDFHPKQTFRAHSLAIAQLQTGRTHQIRVHAQAIGHPLVGDAIYGASGRLPRTATDDLISKVRNFSRHALHSAELRFDHPVTGKQLDFSSNTPEDMRQLIESLQHDRNSLLDS